MLLRPVTPEEMRAGSLLSGIALVLFLAAPRMGRVGGIVRAVVLVGYVLALAGFLIYALMT